MILDIIYSSVRNGKKVIIDGELGIREYTDLTKKEAEIAYLEEYNRKIFVNM